MAESVRRLRNFRAAGATGITAELLKGWLNSAEKARKDAAQYGEEPEQDLLEPWLKVVELVQHAYTPHGELPKSFYWNYGSDT